MPANLNSPLGPPLLGTDNAFISFKPFVDGTKLMFWGPNQAVVDTSPSTYNPPSGFKSLSPLKLPRVARFLSLDRVSFQWVSAHLGLDPYKFAVIRPDLSVLDTTWPAIRTELAARYTGKYFYAQKYRRQNMLDCVSPTLGRETEKWFGPKVLNVVIITEPLGYDNFAVNRYNLVWPPPGWDAALARIESNLTRWGSLRTVFYCDRYNMQRIMDATIIPRDEVSTPPVPEQPNDADTMEMVDYTITQVQTFCTEHSSWATYGGTISSTPAALMFHELLDEHLQYVE